MFLKTYDGLLNCCLFPLDRRWRLAGHIVHHAVDPRHLVDDAVGRARQQIVRQARPVGGHEVLGGHRAQGDGFLVGARIAHHCCSEQRE